MNLINYRELKSHEVIHELDRYLKLTSDQRRIVQMSDFPFMVAEHKPKVPVKPIWRFTILFYFVFLITLILIVMPIKWVFTGSRYLPLNSWCYKLYVHWARNLGFF